MKRFKSRNNTNIVIVSDLIAAGMCKYTLSKTLVIYKYENEDLDFSRVMEHKEFHSKFKEIK